MNDTITVENLTFELRRSEKRSTIGITIGRMGELVLSAPSDSPRELIERAVQEKYRWIATKLAQKEMLFRQPPTKEFIDGEGFYYLGRNYRLRIIYVPMTDICTPPLQLHKDRFLLRHDEVPCGEEHFVNWYVAQGQEWLRPRVDTFMYRIDARPRAIKVQPLGYRWGSCGQSDALYFHWRTILLPPPIIDYIVVHELVHLLERRHNRLFWEHVERAMPDYTERKRWLAENGSRY